MDPNRSLFRVFSGMISFSSLYYAQHFVLFKGSRIVTNGLASCYPKTSHALGTIIGLLGYSIVLCSNNNEVVPFIVGSAIVGFSETISSMQCYVRSYFSDDMDKCKIMLSSQYISVMMGVLFAFLFGGVIYQKNGINGAAIYGIVLQSFELLALFAFFLMSESIEKSTRPSIESNLKHNKNAQDKRFDEDPEKQVSNNDNVMQIFGDELFTFVNENFAISIMSASWINYLIAATFRVQALAISSVLVIDPVFMHSEFRISTGII